MSPSAPLVVSAENAHQLWCLVEGDSVPFPVTVPTDTHIAGLKKLIHINGILDKNSVLAHNLTLWKVSAFST
jgi:hypothetical protein